MNKDYPMTMTDDDFDSDEEIVTSDDFSSEELYILLHIIENGTSYMQDLMYDAIDKNAKHRKKLEKRINRYNDICMKALNWIGVIAENKEEEEEEENCEICKAMDRALEATSEEGVEHK